MYQMTGNKEPMTKQPSLPPFNDRINLQFFTISRGVGWVERSVGAVKHRQ